MEPFEFRFQRRRSPGANPWPAYIRPTSSLIRVISAIRGQTPFPQCRGETKTNRQKIRFRHPFMLTGFPRTSPGSTPLCQRPTADNHDAPGSALGTRPAPAGISAHTPRSIIRHGCLLRRTTDNRPQISEWNFRAHPSPCIPPSSSSLKPQASRLFRNSNPGPNFEFTRTPQEASSPTHAFTTDH
jgi:hypothetical protein